MKISMKNKYYKESNTILHNKKILKSKINIKNQNKHYEAKSTLKIGINIMKLNK